MNQLVSASYPAGIEAADLAYADGELAMRPDCSNPDTMSQYDSEETRKSSKFAAHQLETALVMRKALLNEPGLYKNRTNRLATDSFSVAMHKTVKVPSRCRANIGLVIRQGMRRYVMPNLRSLAVVCAAAYSGLLMAGQSALAQQQSAVDAAQELAHMLDGASMDLSSDNLVHALQDAADAGQPIAMWQLGLMYESGVGVEKDASRAFHYFSQIANDHADAPPRSLDADIVAQSFVKMGDYYLHGVPDAGIYADTDRAHALMMHAASYFGDADAQYRVGIMFLDPEALGNNPLQSARWLSLAARKGHPGAQARLGALLFNGDGIEPQPVEGLMWLNIAARRASGTGDEGWIREMTEYAMAAAHQPQIDAALRAADTLGPQFVEY